MLDQVSILNRNCYKEKLLVVSTFNNIRALLKEKPMPPRRLLCANEKEYMGSMLLYFMKTLQMLKEDKKLFEFFLKVLEEEKGLTEDQLDMLADDLVYLFFSDFTSNERSILNILRQFENLIQVILRQC